MAQKGSSYEIDEGCVSPTAPGADINPRTPLGAAGSDTLGSGAWCSSLPGACLLFTRGPNFVLVSDPHSKLAQVFSF